MSVSNIGTLLELDGLTSLQNIPEDLSVRDYKDQVCVDFSTIVVKTMSLKHENVGGITWKHADVRCMDEIPSASIDFAFDKGTLDAMIYGSPWDPPDEVSDNTGRYIREVSSRRLLRKLSYRKNLTFLTLQISRVLKSDGVFIYVTYRQPHFIKPLLNCEAVNWDIEVDVLGDSANSFEYFGFVVGKVPSTAVESTEAETEQKSST